MRSRPVTARASRTAVIAASVPDETRRTISHPGIAVADAFGQNHLGLGRCPVGRAPRRRVADRPEHHRVGVAEDRRAPRLDVVDVTVAVDVREVGAVRLGDEERLAADGAKACTGESTPPGITRLARASRAALFRCSTKLSRRRASRRPPSPSR